MNYAAVKGTLLGCRQLGEAEQARLPAMITWQGNTMARYAVISLEGADWWLVEIESGSWQVPAESGYVAALEVITGSCPLEIYDEDGYVDVVAVGELRRRDYPRRAEFVVKTGYALLIAHVRR